MKNTLSETQIRARFASRRWAVNVSINSEPVNHSRPVPAEKVEYWPQRGEVRDHALERFWEVVDDAAATSLDRPVVLNISCIEKCDDAVIGWLTALITSGRYTERPNGMLVPLNPHHLLVNLWLNENDRATPGIVERIVGKSPGGTVAGMSKMPGR